jgi:hypothetical protein
VLAVAAFVNLRFGSSERARNWVKARAASEALKSEAFKYAAGAAPYDDPATANAALKKESRKIELGVDDLRSELVQASKPGSAPTAPLTHDQYVEQRVRGQIDRFYNPKANSYRAQASTLRAWEVFFALLATVITAAVGAMTKYPVTGFSFDLAALTSVLTTIGATILAHIQASRYDFLVTSYRATARRLEEELLDLKAPPARSPADWSTFVEHCESIIASENQSWVAKWTGPTATGPTAPSPTAAGPAAPGPAAPGTAAPGPAAPKPDET